jgi:hypothetical protein
MRDDSPENDPRTIWQNQPTEPSVMTSEKIRQKTRELHAKTRQKLLGGIAVSLLVAGISGYGIASGDGPVIRAVFAFAIAWSMAGQYFVNRGMWSAVLPHDAAMNTGLESYRREVERRRYLFGRVMLWSFGPVVLAIATLIALIMSFGIRNRGLPLKGTLLNMTPFLSLVVIWIVGVFVIRMREQRELQREIDELNDIERENRR